MADSEYGLQPLPSDTTLLYRLTLDQAGPWFKDMRDVVREAARHVSELYDGNDDPPQWVARLICLDDDLSELEK